MTLPTASTGGFVILGEWKRTPGTPERLIRTTTHIRHAAGVLSAMAAAAMFPQRLLMFAIPGQSRMVKNTCPAETCRRLADLKKTASDESHGQIPGVRTMPSVKAGLSNSGLQHLLAILRSEITTKYPRSANGLRHYVRSIRSRGVLSFSRCKHKSYGFFKGNSSTLKREVLEKNAARPAHCDHLATSSGADPSHRSAITTKTDVIPADDTPPGRGRGRVELAACSVSRAPVT